MTLSRVLRILALTSVMASVCTRLPAQVPHPDRRAVEFQKIATPGVSNSLLEDRDGFLWFGTDVGLWRYDGYDFRSFSHIVPERIDTAMFQDSSGTLWIGAESGLIALDPATGLRRTYTQNPNRSGALSSSTFQYKKHVFCEDSLGRLWVATDKGINRYDLPSDGFSVFTARGAGLIDDYVTAMISSRDGTFWVASFRGLQKFDPVSGRAIEYVPGAPRNMYTLAEDTEGNLWIGAYLDGVYRMDAKTRRFTRYRKGTKPGTGLSSNIVTHLFFPRGAPEELWIATFDGGLNILDTRTGEVNAYQDDPNGPVPYSISGSALSHIIQDRMGAILVLNEHGFLNRIDPATRRFTTLSCTLAGPGGVPRAAAYSAWTDSAGRVWISAGTRKVGRFDPVLGKISRIADLPEGNTGIVATESDGSAWIALEGSVARFDPVAGRIVESVRVDGLRLSGISDRTNPDLLWLGSANAGIVKVSKRSRRADRIPDPADGARGASPQRLILEQDYDGTIWVSAFGVGLQRFDPRTERFQRTYRAGASNLGNPAGFLRDQNGACWVSFQNAGPALFDPDTGTFTPFEKVAGQNWPARGSTSMLADKAGNLWISGNGSGEIVRFNPSTLELRLYTGVDGVAPGTSETMNRHPVSGADGSFWFPGMGGVTRFHPERIEDNPYIPPVHITGLYQEGEALVPADPEASPGTVVLEADRNYFDFEAAVLNYRLSERNRYEYRLIGRDTKWIDGGTRRTGHYSGLGEGMYILEVRGSNNDGIRNDIPARAFLYVRPNFPKDTRVVSLDELRRGRAVRLRGGVRDVAFEAVPLDFSILEEDIWEYRLEGYDSEWSRITSRRFIEYRKVAPDRYTFRIRRVGVEVGQSIRLIVEPPFYRSWWFLTLAAAAALAVVGGFSWQRRAHLETERDEFRRHRAEEERLVQERHDAVDARLAAVSAREKAVEALNSIESRQRNLLDTMTEGFAVCDTRGALTYVNGRLEELLGYSAGELLGVRITSLVEASRVDRFGSILVSLERGDSASAEVLWTRKDGTLVPTLVSAKPISGPDGRVTESFAVITDVSVLKDVEGQLRQREQDLMKEAASLEELNTALKVLLEKREEDSEGVKSGLLRELGSVVMPYLEKLRESGLEDRQRKLADTIDSNLAGLAARIASELGARSAGLTSAEEQVMDLVRDGKQTKEIAEILGVSRRTVEFHRSNIRKKLGMKGKGGDLRTRA